MLFDESLAEQERCGQVDIQVLLPASQGCLEHPAGRENGRVIDQRIERFILDSFFDQVFHLAGIAKVSLQNNGVTTQGADLRGGGFGIGL